MKQSEVEKEVKANMVREGYVHKRSKYLKEWRERWVVLTRHFFFTFKEKQDYRSPTQVIRLADTLVLKSYFGKGDERAHSFAIKTHVGVFLFSCSSVEERIGWLTQAQKCIAYSGLAPPSTLESAILEERQQSVSSTRISQIESIRSEVKDSIHQLSSNPQLIEQFRATLSPTRTEVQLPVPLQHPVTPQPNFTKRAEEKVPSKMNLQDKEKSMLNQLNAAKEDISSLRYRETVTERSEGSKAQLRLVVAIFEVIDKLQQQKVAKLLVDLLCQLNATYKKEMRKQILFVTLMHEKSRYFCELLLQAINRETQPQRIFNDLLMIECLVSHEKEVFYKADLQILLNVIVRELESYRAEVHQYMCLKVFESIVRAPQYASVRRFRHEDFKTIMLEIADRGGEASALAKRIMDIYK